jgi:sec-independent protein translocase protein TatA
MMGLDNPLHIAFLLIVLLMVFGAKRLPEMGRSLGNGMRGFRDSLNPDSAGTAPTQLGAAAAEPLPTERPEREPSAA